MCRRFTAGRVNATGSSNDVGLQAAGRPIGLVPGDMQAGTTLPLGQCHVADMAVGLVNVTVGGPIEEPHVSVLTLGLEAL